MPPLLTVGHSNHLLERFLELLRAQQVAVLVDVRSRPYSKHAPQYIKADLERAVEARGVRYLFLGRGLGGFVSREPDEDRIHAYGRRAREPDFQRDLRRVVELASEQQVALMCAEENPCRCHRRWLLAKELASLEVEVLHLRGDGRLQRDNDLAPRQLRLF